MNRKKSIYIESKKGKLVALLLTCFVLMLSVGYTALNEELTISGEASFRVEEDIRVTKINILETTNNALEDYSPNYSKDTVKVGITLPNNNSTVKYRVKITNYSNCAMKITSIGKTVTNNNYNITFNKTLPLKMSKLSEEEIEITFSNNTNESQTLEVSLKFTFEKLEAVMTTGSSGGGTSTFYRGPLTKESIESIDFVSSKDVPNDAIGYWDCSYTQGSNEVIAYYLDEDEDNLYELYIGADGEVYAPSNSSSLFQNFNTVVSINFNNSFNTEKATAMSTTFGNCPKLENLDLTNFNTEKVTTIQYIFVSDSSLTDLNLSSFDTSKITQWSFMFSGCTNLQSLNLSGWSNDKITDMSGLFNSLKKLKSINLTNFKTTNVSSFKSMFYNCNALESLDLSGFNTEKVNTMFEMFAGCNTLTTLNLSNFNMDKVKSSLRMFGYCNNLTSITFGNNLNTTELTNMSQMFIGCSKLTSLDLKGFNTSNVTNMSNMFTSCTLLSSLDITSFNTLNVTDMSQMFSGCKNIQTIDLSSFEVKDGLNMSTMFYQCSKLSSIDLRNMDFENKTVTTTNMFQFTTQVIDIYAKNEYNKNYIEEITNNANVIIPEA